MADLQGTLSLDTGDAESSIAALGPLFDETVAGFSATLSEALTQLDSVAVTIEEPDTTPVTEAIANAMAEGAGDGAAAVETAVSGIEVEPVEITVEADTSAAEASIDDMGGAAEGATASVGGLSEATGGLGAASGLAEGSVGGLGNAIQGLGGNVGVAAGAFTVVAGTVGAFFNEAVDALGATQQFDNALGDMAVEVENLTAIEGLNTNLGDLALTLGSDDDKIRSVVARLFSLAEASGLAKEEASVFTQQMVALSARAVALNPSLGDVGDVTDSMARAFARGGNALAKLGLDISRSEIETRALADTGKATADELTVVEKAAAGAAIGFEKYGDNLEKIVAQGSENAAIRQRRLRQEITETFEALGAPLVAPIFELLEEGQPVVEAVGRLFTSLARAALPTLTAVLQGIVPVLTAFSDVVAGIPPPLLASVVAFSVFRSPIAALLPLIAALDPDLVKLVGTLVAVAGVAKLAAAAFSAFHAAAISSPLGAVLITASAVVSVIGLLAGGMGEAAAATSDFARALEDANGELDDTGVKAARSLLETRNQIDDITSAGINFRDVLDELTSATDDERDALDDLASTLDRYETQESISNDARRDAIETIRETNPELAKQLAQLDKAGQLNAGLAKTLAELARQYADTNTMLKERKQAGLDVEQQEQREIDVAKQSEEQQEATAKAIEEHQRAIEQFADAASGAIPTIASLFDHAASEAEKFGGAINPEQFKQDIDKLTADLQAFPLLVEALFRAGLQNVAQVVIDEGPVVGGGFARIILDGNQDFAHALDVSLGTAEAGVQKVDDFFRNVAAPQLVGAWEAFHDQYPDITRETFDAIQGQYNEATGQVGTAAAGLGTAATNSYGSTVTGMTPETTAALSGVGAVFDQSFSEFGSPARLAGLRAGGQFAEGMATGIYLGTAAVEGAARAIVQAALDAANQKAQNQSPSKLFAREVGAPIALGVAQGIEQNAAASQRAMQSLVTNATSVDNSFSVGAINVTAPGPEAAGRATLRSLRRLQFLGG